MANPSVTTPASGRPITVAEIREQFKYTETAEDGLLTAYIDAATAYLEGWLRRAFLVRTLTLYLDSFNRRDGLVPASGEWEIVLPMPPLVTVASVKYYDSDGVLQTVAEADYQTDTISEPGRVKPAVDCAWPGVQAGRYNAVEIQYTAGYATADAVPEVFKNLLRWIAALWFRNREPVAPADLRAVPHTVEAFVEQFKVWRIG